MDIGQSVKELRKSRGLSQIDFAKEIGVTQGYLSKVEKGKTAFSKPTLDIIQKKFGVSFVLTERLHVELDDNQRFNGYETLRQLKLMEQNKKFDDMLELVECVMNDEFFLQERNLIELGLYHAKALAKDAFPKFIKDEDKDRVRQSLEICTGLIKRFPKPVDIDVILRVYEFESVMFNCLDEHESAVSCLLNALELFRSDRTMEAEAQLHCELNNKLAITYFYMGKHDDAYVVSKNAVDCIKSAVESNVGLYAVTLSRYAACADRIGDIDTMERAFNDAIVYHRLVGQTQRAMFAMNNLAAGQKRNGFLDKAEGTYRSLVELIHNNPDEAHPLLIAELEKDGYKISL